jgi:hypothetical protein
MRQNIVRQRAFEKRDVRSVTQEFELKQIGMKRTNYITKKTRLEPF